MEFFVCFHQNLDIGVTIPTSDEFDLLKEVENVLVSFENSSRVLSAEKHSTMTMVLTDLVNIHHWCDQKKEISSNQAIKQLVTKIKELLDAEFPFCGSQEKMIRQAHMLHPYYKGLLLKKFEKFDFTKQEMINEHQSTSDFLHKQRTVAAASEHLFTGYYYICIL